MRMEARSLLVDVTLGALAGAAATWLMGKATSVMYEREDPVSRQQEDDARGGKTSFGVAAERAAALAGRDLTDEQRQQAGNLLHWGIGIGTGAVYGSLRNRFPAVSWGLGLPFGVAFFLAVDELANTALGLTPPPNAFPWEAHARGLVGHVVYGVATESSLRLLDSAGHLASA